MTRKQRKRLRRTGYADKPTRREHTAREMSRSSWRAGVAVAVEIMCLALASFRGSMFHAGARHDEQAIATSAQWQRLGVVGRWWNAWMDLWRAVSTKIAVIGDPNCPRDRAYLLDRREEARLGRLYDGRTLEWRREVLGQWVEPSSPPVFAPQTYTGAVRRLLGDRLSTMDYEIEHAVETSIADVDARAGAVTAPDRDDLVVALAASRVARREGWSGERQMPLVERVRFLWDELERDTGERALRLNEPANWLRAERNRMLEERGAEAAAQLLAMAPPTMSPEAIDELRREFLPSDPVPPTSP